MGHATCPSAWLPHLCSSVNPWGLAQPCHMLPTVPPAEVPWLCGMEEARPQAVPLLLHCRVRGVPVPTQFLASALQSRWGMAAPYCGHLRHHPPWLHFFSPTTLIPLVTP